MLMMDLTFWLLLIASPFVGSFLGVLAVRLPDRRPVIAARSQCDSCEHVLAPRDLIPLLSWLFARGRCRYCDQPIGWFAPAIELAAMFVVLWGASVVSGDVLIATCIFGWTLLVLGIIDAKHFLLPDSLCAFLALSGLVATLGLVRQEFVNHLIGGFAGVLFFILLATLYRKIRGREGVGLGDAKLMGAIGLWLGWQALPTVVLFAAVLGLLSVCISSLTGKSLSFSLRLPLGTFLAVAAWIVWLYGPLVPA
jgi:leader peptidase (prepilin peptidase)/N-methyltransferase